MGTGLRKLLQKLDPLAQAVGIIVSIGIAVTYHKSREIVMPVSCQEIFQRALNSVEGRDFKALENLIRSDKRLLDLRDARGNTLLDHVISSGDVELVKLVINLGCDVNVPADGTTYLHDAVDMDCLSRSAGIKTDSFLCIGRLLLQAGANTESRGYNDWTPLHRAAISGCVEFVSLLLDSGADINARTTIDEHETPLMEAALAGKADVVRLLLDRGADSTLKNLGGRTAEQIAEKNGNREVVKVFENWKANKH
jgi:ankyrin repeat protein